MAICCYAPNKPSVAPRAAVTNEATSGVHPRNSNGQHTSSDHRLAILNAHRAECKAELLQDELQAIKKCCERLEHENSSLRRQLEQAANPPPCTLPHGMTENEYERVELLEESMARLEDSLEQAEVQRSVLEADLILVQEENRALEERCIQLGEDVANPPPCTLPHGMTEQGYEMLEHLKKHMVRLEDNLEQAKVKRSAVVAPLAPPPTPRHVFRRHNTEGTLVCPGAETVTAKTPAKAMTTTKAAVAKAAKAIKKAARAAIAHMCHHR
ncbi:hypothetical protein IWW48_005054 [Coemansia sp. RSA 1200]|nr:hypothetical protein IWW48_005054 [Coemansia sp. RSA 1200]